MHRAPLLNGRDWYTPCLSHHFQVKSSLRGELTTGPPVATVILRPQVSARRALALWHTPSHGAATLGMEGIRNNRTLRNMPARCGVVELDDVPIQNGARVCFLQGPSSGRGQRRSRPGESRSVVLPRSMGPTLGDDGPIRARMQIGRNCERR
ncbi:hypothetical protein LZ30DRAFT_706413 [Colletotrichum cereale]|nr:hypothetical protein LZ30DRAFT_706413 [Colletotrichum cereale]